MSVRITQQVRLIGYTADPNARVTAVAKEVVQKADPEARVTGMALEVIRSTVASSGTVRPIQFVICSG